MTKKSNDRRGINIKRHLSAMKAHEIGGRNNFIANAVISDDI